MSAEPDSRKVNCPGCGTLWKIPASAISKRIRCRNCEMIFSLAKPVSVADTTVHRVAAQSDTWAGSTSQKFQLKSPAQQAQTDLGKAQSQQQRISTDDAKARDRLSNRLMAAVIVCAVLMMPVIYIAFSAGLSWIASWHTEHSLH